MAWVTSRVRRLVRRTNFLHREPTECGSKLQASRMGTGHVSRLVCARMWRGGARRHGGQHRRCRIRARCDERGVPAERRASASSVWVLPAAFAAHVRGGPSRAVASAFLCAPWTPWISLYHVSRAGLRQDRRCSAPCRFLQRAEGTAAVARQERGHRRRQRLRASSTVWLTPRMRVPGLAQGRQPCAETSPHRPRTAFACR